MNIASVIMLFFIFGIVIGSIFMFHFPRTVWELTEPPTTVGTEFEVGDLMIIETAYCKTKDVKGEMILQYIDGVIYTTPTYEGNLEVGCKPTSQSFIVPSLPAGEYNIRVTFTHHANIFRTITSTYETNKFFIK